MVKILKGDDEDFDDYKDFLSDDSDEKLSAADYEAKLKLFEKAVAIDNSFNSIVFVGNLPKVGKDKHEGLKEVLLTKKLARILQKRGDFMDVSNVEVEFQMDKETDEFTGCTFLKFPSANAAQLAAACLNGAAFDRQYTLVAHRVDDIEKILSNEPAGPPEFQRGNLMWWLKSENHRGREQFVVRAKKDTTIYWHDPVGRQPIFIYNGDQTKKPNAQGPPVWTYGKVEWSPQGSYFLTYHKQGFALWGGPSFERFTRFEHKNASDALFSPNEEYLITHNDSPPGSPNEGAVKIWHVTTASLLRMLKTPICSYTGDEVWPFFTWSYDSSYMAARIDSDPEVIRIYFGPHFSTILDMSFELPLPKTVAGQQPPLKTKDAKPQIKAVEQGAFNLDMAWSPTAHILSVFSPEKGESPSRVVLFEIPSKNELASKNLYNVKQASMHWQSKGQYMALLTVIIKKTGKKGKKESTQIEIFRIKDKNCPVDFVQLESLKVRTFAWETGGSRLAILAEYETNHPPSILLYNVNHTGALKETQLVTTFEVSQLINRIHWSPMGGNFIAVAQNHPTGTLVFASFTDQNKVDVYHTDEHSQVSDILWDPSGRYVCTVVALNLPPNSNWRLVRDAGYQIWTFQGRLLYTFQDEEFYIFKWRPRPPSLLPLQKEREVHKTLKDYSKRFDELDESLKREKKELFKKEREAVTEIFMKSIDEAREWSREHPLFDEWTDSTKTFERQFSFEEIITKKEEVIGQTTTTQCS